MLARRVPRCFFPSRGDGVLMNDGARPFATEARALARAAARTSSSFFFLAAAAAAEAAADAAADAADAAAKGGDGPLAATGVDTAGAEYALSTAVPTVPAPSVGSAHRVSSVSLLWKYVCPSAVAADSQGVEDADAEGVDTMPLAARTSATRIAGIALSSTKRLDALTACAAAAVAGTLMTSSRKAIIAFRSVFSHSCNDG